MTAQFITTRRVEFADTDMAGIIHFANYYRYMEEAEHAFFRSLGLRIMQSQPDGSVIGWPRQFRPPVRLRLRPISRTPLRSG